MEYITLTK